MIVLKFGVRNFLSGEQIAHTEMHVAHQLYNALVAVERWRRREFGAVRSRHVPGLTEIDAAYEQLSEWIGEHSGPTGKRGVIREKRRKETAKTGVPVKRVDAQTEIDVIAELKIWRKAAGEIAKPLREQFELLLHPAQLNYEARTRGVPIEWLEERNKKREERDQAKKEDKPRLSEKLEKLIERIESGSRKTHKKAAANTRVLAEMLAEPDWSEAWKDIARLDDTAHRLRQWVGDAHNLNHGTYVAVQDAVDQAGKRPRPRPDGEPRKPRQRPAFAQGRLRKMGWQLQGTVTWGDILNGKSNNAAVSGMRNTGRQWRAECKIRITTAEQNEWVVLDIVGRRRIPNDTRIRWVYLVPQSRPHGRHEYEVQFTAEPTSPLIVRAPGEGHARIHLCWTQEGETVVVARVNDTSILLPYSVPGKLKHAESVRGAADKHFDTARAEVALRVSGWPLELQQACSGLAQWRRHEKLHRISEILREKIPNQTRLDAWGTWSRHRLSKNLDLFAPLLEYTEWAITLPNVDVFALWLETWRRKDKHLVQMEDGLRRSAIGRRRDFYRTMAAQWCTEFSTYEFTGAVNLEALALRDKAEDSPNELHRAARHNRVIACVSELKESVQYAFGKDRERSGDEKKLSGARSGVKSATSVRNSAEETT